MKNYIDIALRLIQVIALVAIAIELASLTVNVYQADTKWDVDVREVCKPITVDQGGHGWMIYNKN